MLLVSAPHMLCNKAISNPDIDYQYTGYLPRSHLYDEVLKQVQHYLRFWIILGCQPCEYRNTFNILRPP